MNTKDGGESVNYPGSWEEWRDSMAYGLRWVGAAFLLMFVLAVSAGYAFKYWPALVAALSF